MKLTKYVLKFFAYLLLWPFSVLWESIYRIRRFAYNYKIFSQNSYRVPIISVGNISFGGTGKTPFILWLANYFATIDKKALIIMRGHKGTLEHDKGILRGNRKLGFNPIEYGDEALLLARRVKNASIVVGKNRSANLEYYFDEESPDVVLLDDGHQHLKIDRKLNIVLFDALMPLARYKVAPLGYLREGLNALADADIIVIGRADQVAPTKIIELKKLISNYVRPDIFFAEICYRPLGLYNTNYHLIFDILQIRGKRVICVAGIASPVSFFDIIQTLGAEIIDKVSYPDHHYFKKDEILSLTKKAKAHDAYIVTTEKDMVKIRRIVDDDNILFLEIDLNFINGEERVKEIIRKVI